ncbi:large ribosomal subunit protein uL1m-like [Haliotis cracherodii]|uniref:large ribosomal subunit protein uL1m-like n=1 Tax=Haliotis cracherodii TaxID=6455 RepID=UPI0039ED92A2
MKLPPLSNMATSITALRPVLLVQLRSALLQRATPSLAVTPVRWKVTKSQKLRTPHVAKEKEKWVKAKAVRLEKEKDKSKEHPNWMNRKPADDVWIRGRYPPQCHALEECVQRHKEYAHPSMFDNMDGLVYADLELNMSTKKKTKFMRNISSTLMLPHTFEENVVKKCAVFCKTSEDQQKARDLGALYVGDADLIKQIVDGIIDKSEFDFALATPDIMVEMLVLRGILKDMFPRKSRGNMSSSVEEMMTLFQQGVTYTSTKHSDAVGKLQVPLGTLNMSTEQLEENFSAYMESIKKQKAPKLGQFVSQAVLIAPPSPERFHVELEKYMADTSKQKSAMADEDEEEEDESEARN